MARCGDQVCLHKMRSWVGLWNSRRFLPDDDPLPTALPTECRHTARDMIKWRQRGTAAGSDQMSSGSRCPWPRPRPILSRSTFPDASQQLAQPAHRPNAASLRCSFSSALGLPEESRSQVSSWEGRRWKGNGMGRVLGKGTVREGGT